MKFASTLFVLTIIFLSPQAQILAQDKIWYFGNQAGIDFTGSVPAALTDGAMTAIDYAASISDFSGNLLFYTNGTEVWDKSHAIMQNGTGLLGQSSSGQNAIILQQPGTDLFYIFTVGQFNSGNGLRYHIVELSQNNGFGAVISKNNLLMSPSTERLDAVYDHLTNSYWIITHGWNSNEFYSYKITSAGLNQVPVISSVGTIHTGGALGHYNTMGQLCISPGKNKVVCGIYSDGFFELFDFDINTGVLSNPVTLGGFTNAWGAAFSPDGTKLYVTEWLNSDVIQMDITSGAASTILSTATIVGQGTGPGGSYQIGYLQLAPDEKIYGAVFDDTHLLVINNPNASGMSCNLVNNGFYLDGKMSKAGLCRAVSNRTEWTAIIGDPVSSLTIRPNPFVNDLIISIHDYQNPEFDYSVYNSLGSLIQSGSGIASEDLHLNFSGIPTGIYHLVVSDNRNKITFSKKLVKME